MLHAAVSYNTTTGYYNDVSLSESSAIPGKSVSMTALETFLYHCVYCKFNDSKICTEKLRKVICEMCIVCIHYFQFSGFHSLIQNALHMKLDEIAKYLYRSME